MKKNKKFYFNFHSNPRLASYDTSVTFGFSFTDQIPSKLTSNPHFPNYLLPPQQSQIWLHFNPLRSKISILSGQMLQALKGTNHRRLTLNTCDVTVHLLLNLGDEWRNDCTLRKIWSSRVPNTCSIGNAWTPIFF